ncbi:MAG: GAF domain-containing sensor histidine kinase [Candidatus Dormibacteraeota bacterium]|nr:GAF domain-containing sensor histidine kinase [Candidatus Dormibacteraeota bacterium]
MQIALDISGSLDPREVISRVLERGIRAVQADRATLSSVDADSIMIEATYGRAGALTWVGKRYSNEYFAGQPLVKRALDTLQPTFGGQLAVGEAAPEFRDALAKVRHTVVMPLVHGGRAVGLLVLSRYEDRPFTHHDLAALGLLSTISGLALTNARLFEEAELARARADETAARLRSSVEAAEDVASQVELSQVLNRLLRRAATAVGADNASLARVEGTFLIVESTTGEPLDGVIGTRWPIAPAVLEGIKENRAVQLTAGEYIGTPAGLERIVLPYKRFLVAPLAVGGEVIGVIAMGRVKDEPFEATAVESLHQFSTLGALLLRNARLIADAKEAERSKSEFMDIAVHELRAPLTVTGGYLSIALEGGFGELPPALKSVLETAQRKTEEAKRLAEELLAVARLESRTLSPKTERVSMTDALHEAITRAKPRAQLAGATLRMHAVQAVDALADGALVGKILDNLINNAISYSDAAPTIRLSLQAFADHVQVTVADNGAGIPTADRERIFQRFVRGSDRVVRDHQGSGLGLYLSRGLAQRMNGSLELLSTEPGKGSTFLLRLPSAP